MSMDTADRPALMRLARKLGATLLGALRNRGELLAVEWQLEKARLMTLLIILLGVLFLGMLGLVMLTIAVMLMLPTEFRVCAAGGFALVYLLGSFGSWLWAKKLLKQEPFGESILQLQKDRVWLDSSE